MKKNLFLLIFVFSVFYVGLSVIETEASPRLLKDVKSDTLRKTDPLRSDLINKTNKAFLKLKQVCANTTVGVCADMIAASAEHFDDMIATCSIDATSQDCADAQELVDIAARATIAVCERWPEHAKIIQRREVIPFLNRSTLLKATEV